MTESEGYFIKVNAFLSYIRKSTETEHRESFDDSAYEYRECTALTA